MEEGKHTAGGRALPYEPAVVDAAHHGRSTWGTIALGVLLLAIVAGTELLPPHLASLVVITSAIALAAIGVLSLFAHALGLVGFRTETRGDVFSRALADADHRGRLVTDAESRVLYANRAYADMTGALQARDVRSIERVFQGAEEAETEIYRLNRAAIQGDGAECEVRASGLHALGEGEEARWYRLSCRPFDPDGDTKERSDRKLLAWEIEDVTDARREREAEFAALRQAVEAIDAAPVGLLTVGVDDRIRFVNSGFAHRLGIDLVSDAKMGALSDHRVGEPVLRNVAADGTRTFEAELKLPEGGTAPVWLYEQEASGGGEKRVLVVERGAAVAGTGAFGGAKLFAASPMAIASLDVDGAVAQSNAAFAATFAKSGRMPGGIADLAEGDERLALARAFDQATQGTASGPLELVAKGGEIIQVHLVPLDETGEDEQEAVLLYAMDVTEQRALEREMADTQKNQAIAVIASGVAHDFNNVLTAIVGFSDLLLAKYRPTDRSFHDVTQIRNTAFKGASLVRHLMAYSRAQTLRPRTLSLPEVLTDLSMILRRLAGERIRVDIRHGRDLWPVRADVTALERVFTNLCVNARDAINDRVEADLANDRKPGESLIKIRTENVEAERVRSLVGDADVPHGDQLLIEVSDTGTGMSREVMAKVFDPFFTTKKAGKGTGLGLSSVVGIVKQSGGSIHLDSQPGRGTTFRILLPRHHPTEAELEAPVAVAKEAPRDLAGNATILFVEDEDSVRAFGTRTLKERGYIVHEAENGEDALEIIEELEGAIDLVVSDVVMPEMDGPTLFRHVRETSPEIPFIFASGYAEEAFEKSLPNAADARFGFIPKPYTLKDLAIVVKDTLEERSKAA